MHSLDPRIVTVWRLSAALGWGLLLVVVLPLDLARWWSADPFGPVGLPSVLVVALAVYFIGVRPRRLYRSWRYALEDDALLAEHGLLTHTRTIVPRVRVQHLDVVQGLIEREHGLARLVVHTAGTRDATVTVPGLPLADAEALRDELRRDAAEEGRRG